VDCGTGHCSPHLSTICAPVDKSGKTSLKVIISFVFMNLISGQLRDDTVVVGGVHNPYCGAAGLVHLWIASLRSGYVPGGIRVLAAILRRTNMPRTDSPTIPSTKAGSSLQQWRVAAAFGLFPSSPKDYSARNDQWTKQMQDDPARPAAQIPLAGVIGMPSFAPLSTALCMRPLRGAFVKAFS